MKLLVVGSGGREHAISWKLLKSEIVSQVFQWPGNFGSNLDIPSIDLPASADFSQLVALLKKEKFDAVVVGPEGPLDEGISDYLEEHQIPVFGPRAIAAKLESDKSYAKSVMEAAKVPTAKYITVNNAERCKEESRSMLAKTGGVVLKASGLAAGKGVFVCTNELELENALDRLYNTSLSGASKQVVIEEVLVGRECSFFVCLGDSDPYILDFAVDFKRLSDNDQGPNTGGMGSYSPVPWLPNNASDLVMERVVNPLISTLGEQGISYKGFLYVGLMWNESGPQVVEFNVRLGDPEAQILALNDKNDWGKIIASQLGIYGEKYTPKRNESVSVGVVVAADGYPYEKSKTPGIRIDDANCFVSDSAKVFFASAIKAGDDQVCAGPGRSMTVVASGKNFSEAREGAYGIVQKISSKWPSAIFRSDIAAKV